ncbi:unnamed protein product [Chrysoparadoxa australica]
MSLRGDILKNPEYVRELTKLQDEVGTFPNDVAMRIIEDDLGRPPNELFEFLYPDPVASASIGQVYKVRVRSTGLVAALKVQRPEAFESAAVDMFILRRFAAWFKVWKKLNTDMVGVCDEFGKQLFGELDYEQEARNCKRFGELYGGIPGIFVPDVDMNLTRRRVLVQEWVDGEKGPWAEGGEKMLSIGLQCSVLQILDSGFMHCDPHQGNLLKRADDTLAYIDFGMMANVTVDTRYALIGTTLGLQNKDIGMIGTNLVKLGFLPDETNLDTLIPALEKAVMDASSGGGASSLNFTRLNENVNKLSADLTFRVPPFYSLVVRTLTILEGLALDVDPDFRLVRGAYPYIAKQILGSNTDAMADLMKEVLVTSDGGINWSRLEELVSIAGAAKVVESDRDFANLQQAQFRSDLKKKLNGPETGVEETPEVTFDMTLEVLSFILSDQGKFLRDPLIKELLDTIDSLSVAGVNLASAATGGIISAARDEPDQAKLEALWGILVQIVQNQRRMQAGQLDRNGNVENGGFDMPLLRSLATSILEAVRDPSRQAQLRPIMERLAGFAREVIATSVERQARRVVRTAVGFIGGPQVMTGVANVLDVIAREESPARVQSSPTLSPSPARAGTGGERAGSRNRTAAGNSKSGSSSGSSSRSSIKRGGKPKPSDRRPGARARRGLR